MTSPPEPSPYLLTQDEARAERVARLHRHAQHCILVAVVTSGPIAAELIDKAAECTRALVCLKKES